MANSLALFPDSTVSPALADWLAMTPAVADWLATAPSGCMPELMGAIAWAVAMDTLGECYECKTEHAGRDLRCDRAYFESGNLICKTCWHFHDSGTPARPDYKAPEWPAKRAPDEG